jgi:molybdopterin synthase sulfur carrier subunit
MSVLVRIPTPYKNSSATKPKFKLKPRRFAMRFRNSRRRTKNSNALARFRRIAPLCQRLCEREDVRFLQKLDTPLKDGDEVSIVPAIAGG